MTARVVSPHIVRVRISDRVEFDQIDKPVWDWTQAEDPQPLLTKEITDGAAAVIFEHWLHATTKSPAISGL